MEEIDGSGAVWDESGAGKRGSAWSPGEGRRVGQTVGKGPKDWELRFQISFSHCFRVYFSFTQNHLGCMPFIKYSCSFSLSCSNTIYRTTSYKSTGSRTGVSNPWPTAHRRPRMAMNVAQHKAINLLKTLLSFITKFSSLDMYIFYIRNHKLGTCSTILKDYGKGRCIIRVIM